MPKKRDLTVAEYLCQMGQAVVCANIEAMRSLQEIVATDSLDAEMPIGEHTVKVDGASLMPEGHIGLDELEVECESDVSVSYNDDGKPIGLAMSMHRNLFKRCMHVKFKAKFSKRGEVEGIEVLRDVANEALRQTLVAQNITTNIRPKKETN